jgi:hypothetical protein
MDTVSDFTPVLVCPGRLGFDFDFDFGSVVREMLRR